jgi:hypothetical protein
MGSLDYRARICKHLMSPGIDSKESIPPAYVAWRAGTSNRVVIPARQAGNRFLGSLALQIRAMVLHVMRELSDGDCFEYKILHFITFQA